MSLATLLQTNEIPLARDNGPLTVVSAEQTANAAQHVAPVEGAYDKSDLACTQIHI